MNYSERAERERERYNTGIERQQYDSIFRHCIIYTNTRKKRYLQAELLHGHGKSMLEIGGDAWSGWLENMDIHPEKIDIINIAEAEIEKAKINLPNATLKPNFYVMDAHNMKFESESYDVVFGGAILHHLHLTKALPEIKRILKHDGKFVFWEPLGMNPVAALIRKLTPNYRTIDEQAFRIKEIKIAKKYFKIKIIPFEFIVTPAGIISKYLFKNPFNILTNTAYFIDIILLRAFPPIKYIFRSMIFIGYKNH